MVSQAHAQMVLTALGSLSQIAASRASSDTARDQLRYQHAIEELRTGALAHVVDALITGRIGLVHDGFVRVLQDYAKQAEHFMAQQTKFVDAELATSDPLRRTELRTRINAIDIELQSIRVAGQRIYNRMTEVVRQIGGTSLVMDAPSSRYLALPIR